MRCQWLPVVPVPGLARLALDPVGGLADEFYHRIYEYYQNPQVWEHGTREAFFEWMPDNWGVDGKRAEQIKRQYLFEPHVFAARLQAVYSRIRAK